MSATIATKRSCGLQPQPGPRPHEQADQGAQEQEQEQVSRDRGHQRIGQQAHAQDLSDLVHPLGDVREADEFAALHKGDVQRRGDDRVDQQVDDRPQQGAGQQSAMPMRREIARRQQRSHAVRPAPGASGDEDAGQPQRQAHEHDHQREVQNHLIDREQEGEVDRSEEQEPRRPPPGDQQQHKKRERHHGSPQGRAEREDLRRIRVVRHEHRDDRRQPPLPFEAPVAYHERGEERQDGDPEGHEKRARGAGLEAEVVHELDQERLTEPALAEHADGRAVAEGQEIVVDGVTRQKGRSLRDGRHREHEDERPNGLLADAELPQGLLEGRERLSRLDVPLDRIGRASRAEGDLRVRRTGRNHDISFSRAF